MLKSKKIRFRVIMYLELTIFLIYVESCNMYKHYLRVLNYLSYIRNNVLGDEPRSIPGKEFSYYIENCID